MISNSFCSDCFTNYSRPLRQSNQEKNDDDDKEETKARLGQAACKCQTQTLESYRSCASKHPKF